MKIFYLMISISLSACAPSSINAVRALGPNKSVSFEASGNYQNVYKKIFEQTQECNDAWMITANVITEGELQPEKKMGTVSVSMRGGLGKSYYQVIDIKEIDSNKIFINAYYSMGAAESHSKLLKKWIFDDYRKCSI